MAKKTGLGKGLDALFSNNIAEEDIKENEVIENLKIIEVNHYEEIYKYLFKD